MAVLERVPEWQVGASVVRPGDQVRCSPPTGERPFLATVMSLRADESGAVVEVEVVGGRDGVRQWRTFAAERVKPPPKRRGRRMAADSTHRG